MRKHSLLLVSCRRQAILTTAIKKILGVSLVCLCFAAQAFGQSETTYPLDWSIDDYGVLTISGTVAMPDYSSGGSPWYGNSSITTVNIEDGVTTIGNYAFEGCSSLDSITIPNSITTIGDSVFFGCTGLTDVTVLRTSPPAISSNTFSGVTLSSATLTVPQGSESAYEAAGWTGFGTIVGYTVAVTSVSLDQTSLDKMVGDSPVTLTATISPSNATNQNVSWSTGDPAVATVSDGVVSFVGAGSTDITVTTQDGNKTAVCNVTVAAVAVTSVSLDQTSLDKMVGASPVTLTATISPSNATNKNLTWSTGDPEVATVSDGTVSFIGVGSTDITVTTVDGDKTATCQVTVTAATVAVASVSLDQTSLDKMVGDSPVTLIATISPSNATNKDVSWSTGDQTVATVIDGTVSFVGIGSTNITVTTVDGGKTAVCNVTVAAVAVTSVSLDQTSLNKTVGDSPVTLVATISPANATNKNVSWSTGDQAVATVIDGTVSFVGVGSTDITVTTLDGDKTAVCNVTVAEASSDIGGTIGTITWSVAEGVLTISGTGDMPDYTYTSYAPWYSYRDDITTVNIEDEVTAVGEFAFNGCSSLDSASIGSSVTIIGRSAFLNCSSLDSVSIGSAVTDIGNYAFNGCSSLASITIPGSVTDIGFYAFSGCSSLTNVTVLGTTPPLIDDNPFYGIDLSSVTLTVPQGCKPDYQSATGWKNFGKFAEDGAPSVAVTDVSLDPISVTLKTGETKELVATVSPATADNKNVTWTSSAEAVATVSSDGVVTAVAVGTATITVTTEEGDHTATCTVTVEEGTTGIAKASADVAVRAEAGKLYINSPAAETVYIYSFIGKLLYTATKASGAATFDAPSEKLLIVRGTSGWARKVSK